MSITYNQDPAANLELGYSTDPSAGSDTSYFDFGQGDVPYNPATDYGNNSGQYNLSSLFKDVKNLFGGTGYGGQLGQLAAFGGVAALLNKMAGQQSQQPVGYQGGIPQYTASRTQYDTGVSTDIARLKQAVNDSLAQGFTMDQIRQGALQKYGISPEQISEAVASPAGAYRRPGQGGITYFSPVQYTATGSDLARPTAGQVTGGGMPAISNQGATSAAQTPRYSDEQVASAIRTSLQQGYKAEDILARAAQMGATADQLSRARDVLQQTGYLGGISTLPGAQTDTGQAVGDQVERRTALSAKTGEGASTTKQLPAITAPQGVQQGAVDKLLAELNTSGSDPRSARWAGSGQYSVLGVPQSAEVYSASDPNFAYKIVEALQSGDPTTYWQKYARQRETGMDIPRNYQQVGSVGGIPLRVGTGPAESGYVWMGNRPISNLSELQAATQKFGLTPAEVMQATRLISEKSGNKAIGGDLYSPIFKAVRDSLQAGYTLPQIYEGAQKNFGVTKEDVDNALRYNNVDPNRTSVLSPEEVMRMARENLPPRAASGGYMPSGIAMLAGGGTGSRYLRGPGDGVSDSIPAKFERSGQPARLADGEFVIDARTVSEIGNGSSEAGARKLYAMMDRVQKARKTAKRGKPSGADKFLPK